MERVLRIFPPVVALPLFILVSVCLVALLSPSLAQEWAFRVEPRGTLKVVASEWPSASVAQNYSESLVALDKDNNHVPCLAEDWRWLDERTIEFKLRRGVFFHNGEEFDAEAVRANWKAYRGMKNPRAVKFTELPQGTALEVADKYRVRFAFPGPDGLALVKFWFFYQIAPAYFKEHDFTEKQWGYLTEPGPWGTGPFKLVEGGSVINRPSDRVVLEAYENYWDGRYPKIRRLVFENRLMGTLKEAMRLCRETEGEVDIVSNIRPLDTLKVGICASSLHARAREEP